MISTILSGLISIAGSLVSGYMGNEATEKAGEKQYGLAMIARGDTLAQQKVENEATKTSLGLKEKELGIAQRKTQFEIAQQKKANRQASLANLSMSLDALNKKDQNMTNFMLSLYGKNNYNAKGIGA